MRTEKSIFHAIPWGAGHWLLGDTDTEWDGEVDTPVANRADVDYVLAKVNSVLRRPVRREEICGVFAGLRPLVAAEGAADTTRLSREHRLFSPVPGLTAIAGGKYTTYRVMARDAVDAAAARPRVDCSFDDRPGAAARCRAARARAEDPLRLRHGDCADEVLPLAAGRP